MKLLRPALGFLTVMTLALTPAVSPMGPFVDDASANATCSPTESTFETSGVTYKVLQFTATGTCDWTIPEGVSKIDYLLVGGGGSGGSTNLGSAGGGGGAEVNEASSVNVTPSSIVAVEVGGGGIPQQISGQDIPRGSDGGTTSLVGTGLAQSARGGSAGANAWLYNPSPQATASTEGFTGGGGSSHAGSASLGSTGVGGATHKGGNAWADGYNSDPQAGGGGGGASDSGQDATSGYAGDGGPGSSSAITGSITYYGGGGGGGKRTSSGNAGEGGQGGGGAGGKGAAGTAGIPNTGGGGGGAGGDAAGYLGGVGGSGIAIVRYSLRPDNPTGLSISSGDGQATLTYTAPNHAGASITDYEYQYRTYSGSAWGNWSGWQSLGETDGSSPISLTNGTLYDVNLRTVNSAGSRSPGVNVGTVIPSAVGEILRLDATHPDSYGGSGTTWTDLAGSLDGTFTDGPTYVAREKAFQFDGTDDYVVVPDIGSDFSNGFALHVVADFGEVADNWERLVDFGNGDASDNFWFGRYNATNDLAFETFTGSTSNEYCKTSGGTAIVPGVHVYSVVMDSDGDCSIYRDGSLLATTSGYTLPTAVVRSSNFLGKSNWTADDYFEGTIQSVVMYNTAQTTPVCKPVESTFTGNGTIGESGVPYKVLQFTTVGKCNWSIPSGVVSADAVIVAGGGGGGAWTGAGGGAGGVQAHGDVFTSLTSTSGLSLSGSDYDITVGNGGAGAQLSGSSTFTAGSNGGDSSIGATWIAYGGGVGGSWPNSSRGISTQDPNAEDETVGSGGGATNGTVGPGSGNSSSFTATGGRGLAGGNATGSSQPHPSGGGGGAGSDGADALSSTTSGAGGDGVQFNIAGSDTWLAGGGGGGIHGTSNTGATDGAAGAGGTGGGGAGSGPNRVDWTGSDSGTTPVGQMGLSGSGGGGGGAGVSATAGHSSTGGDGGSGIVIIRYSLSPTAPSISSVASGDGSIDVTFSAPTHTGGSSITDYEYSFDGTTWTSLSTTSAGTETISGLTNGTAYTVRVRAVNGNGNGVPVTAGSATTPRGTQTLTWSPTNTSVSLGRGTVTLDPAASGLGSPSISYSVQTAGTASCSIADSSTPTVSFSAVGSCVVRATAAEGSYTQATVDVTVNVYPADVPRIWTDFGGFWDSDADVTDKSDAIANVLAFEWHGRNYSTGVSDSTLDSNSVSYQAATFSALELGSLPDTCSVASYSNYYLTRGGGNTNAEAYVSGDPYRALDDVTSCPSGAELAGLLSDGIQGLDISTGVTNIPSSVSGRFALNAINTAAIDDGVPDFLVTQLFSPSGTVDSFYLENEGTPFAGQYDVDLSGITPLDTQFVQQLNNPDSSLSVSGMGQNRDVRVLAFELVDLLGDGDDSSDATHLVWDFSGASDPAFIAVNEASFTRNGQTVTFGSLSNKSYGDSDFALSATASSGLSVSFSSTTTSVCTVSGSTVSIVTPGTCTIQASQGGNLQFAAASAVSRSFTVGPKALYVNVTPAGKTYDGTQVVASFTTSLVGVESGDTVTVDSTKLTVSFDSPSAGSQSASAVLDSGALGGADAAKYTLSLGTVSNATISKASQASLSISSPNSMVYGQTIPVVATGGSGSGALSYSYVSGPCTVSGATVEATGAGSCVVTATRADDDNYNAKTSSNFTIEVAKANQSVNFTSSVPVSAVSGTTYTPTAAATSGLTPSFSITTGSGTVCSLSSGVVTFLTSGTCVITAAQGGDSDHNAASSVTQTIVAGKINQTITFPSISGKNFDDAAFLAGATVSSGRTVTFATSTGSVCAVDASTGLISIKTIGDCTVTASSAGDASYAAASDVSRTFTISPVLAGKPSVTSVSFGNSSVTVAFSAPGANGGDSIDAYQVVATSSGGAVTKPDCSTTSPCTITGLTNGESYTLTVAAINAAGVGPASDASPAVIPATIPDAVSALSTTPGDTQLVVTWTPLTTSQLGGGSFTQYDVSIRVRGQAWSSPVTADGTNNLGTRTTSSYTFTGLTNGTAYDVKVVALTSVNGSALSSNTATALGVPATAPDAPTGLTLTSLSNTSAVASWTAPVDDGGSAITAYSANLSCTFTNNTDTFCTLTGLTAGSRVTVTVGATNLMGTGSTVTAIITMPGGSSGGSSDSSGRTTPTTTPVVTPTVVTPTLLGNRVLPRPPVQTPRILNAPVVTPTDPPGVNEPARVLVGGRPVPTLTEARGASEVNVRAGKIDLGLGASTPSATSSVRTNPTTSAPELTVGRGESTSLNVKGLLPGSTLQVWLPGAEGRELARVPVNPDGSVSEEISLTASRTETPLPLGRQVLQVTGFDEDGNQTVVDMTINIAQGAPSPEPNRLINELPDLQPGESLATSAGVPEVVTISANAETREVSVSSNEWSFRVSVPETNGTVDAENPAAPTIRLIQTRTAEVNGDGFQPDTRVDIFLFSDPTLLGSFTVNADGSFDAEVYMDQRFAVVGDHTLQIQGVGTDGYIKAANLGVLIDETPAATTANNALGMLWWISAVAVVLALIVVLVVASRRRRIG